MEYQILKHDDVVGLANVVTFYLGEGWQLYGDPFVAQEEEWHSKDRESTEVTYYHQAMIRIEQGRAE